MHLGQFREYSVKIGIDKKMCMASGKCRLHSVIMTTANGMHWTLLEGIQIITTANGMQPAFYGIHTHHFIISDLYRYLTDIAEVH